MSNLATRISKNFGPENGWKFWLPAKVFAVVIAYFALVIIVVLFIAGQLSLEAVIDWIGSF